MGPKRHGHFRSPLTGVDLIVLPVKAASERERAMSEGRACVAGSAIVARRESRSAMPDRMPERLKVAARDDSSDDEWGPEEVAGALQTRRTAMRSVAEDRQTVVQMAARKCVRVLITSR